MDIFNHAVIYPQLSDQTRFRLNKINKIEDYSIAKIREREARSKSLSVYIVSINLIRSQLLYLQQLVEYLLLLSPLGAPIEKAKAIFSFV